MGGNATTESNPEQQFAAGYSACFNNALTLILKKAGLKNVDPEVRGTAMLLSDETDSGFKLAANLEVRSDGVPQEDAEKFLQLHMISVHILKR